MNVAKVLHSCTELVSILETVNNEKILETLFDVLRGLRNVAGEELTPPQRWQLQQLQSRVETRLLLVQAGQ
jgi:hypothetical protein